MRQKFEIQELLKEKERAAELAHYSSQQLESEQTARFSALQSDIKTKNIEIREFSAQKQLDDLNIEKLTIELDKKANEMNIVNNNAEKFE